MLQFISPAALWTLAALALPLAIHLRRRPATTVRLGSLRFLDRLPQRRLRHLRWRERTLLLTRLALLALLAFLCANMRWLQPRAPGPQRWLLLDPTARLSGEAAVRARGLLAQGFKAHLLAPGFPDANASTAAFASPGSNVTAPDLWSLLRAADAALPPGSRLAIVTPGRLATRSDPCTG